MTNRSLRFITMCLLCLYNCKYLSSYICRVCNENDLSCKYGTTANQTCPKSSKACFTYYEDDGHLARGCASLENKHWVACLTRDMMYCFECRYDYCNSNPMRIPRTLACVTSRRTPEESPDIMPSICGGEIPIGVKDYCYMVVAWWRDHYAVIDRGCYPYTGPMNNDMALFYCSDQGCNVYGPQNGLMCHVANETENKPQEHGIIRLRDCNQESIFKHRFPAVCFNSISDHYWNDGCLNNEMNEIYEVRECSYYETNNHKRVCQTCVSATACNKFHYGTTNLKGLERCRDESNNIEVCPLIWSGCYIYLQDGQVAQAGCVSPTTRWDILTHQNTHFCFSNDDRPRDGCFDVGRDFSDRISCYTCREDRDHPSCTEPENFYSSFKQVCELGTKRCVVKVMGKDIRRGCDNRNDTTGAKCRENPTLCLYCNTNYCNGLGLQPNRAQCYSNRYLQDAYGTTLELRRCQDRLAAPTQQPCFIAKRPGSVLVRAGCVEDLGDLTDGYQIYLQGRSEIIFEEKLFCYKCRSQSRHSCYNVRWLEPEPCANNGQSALFGCYTLFDQDYDRIERGCLNELDAYHAGLCLSNHFEELCIVCGSKHCNIHTA